MLKKCKLLGVASALPLLGQLYEMFNSSPMVCLASDAAVENDYFAQAQIH